MAPFLAEATWTAGVILLILGVIFKVGKGVTKEAHQQGNKMLIIGGVLFGVGLLIWGVSAAASYSRNYRNYRGNPSVATYR